MKNKTLIRVISLAIFLLSGIFIAFTVAENLTDLPPVTLNASVVFFILICLVFHLLITAIGGSVWHLLLRSTGEPAQLPASVMIFSLAQFAKYIPGNIAHQIGRVALAVTWQMSKSRVIFSMALEACWAIASSAFLAAFFLLISPELSGLLHLSSHLSVDTLTLIAIAATVIPLFAGYLLNKAPGPLKRLIDNNVKLPGVTPLIFCFLLNVAAFFLMGCIVEILISGLFNLDKGNILLSTAVFSVAWIAGFLTPGAPAGLGIREAIMIAALGPIYGAGNAIGITTALRLVTIAGDCLAFGSGLIIRKYLDNKSSQFHNGGSD
jgi:glycosyltransferase 2 family protein